MRELTSDGAVVLLPVGSDEFMKYIADECIYMNPEYDVLRLKNSYDELFGKQEWVKTDFSARESGTRRFDNMTKTTDPDGAIG